MTIPYFGAAQTDAFIPALVWFLLATALAVAPVVLAPVLRRLRAGRVLTVVAVLAAVVAVVPGVLQTAHGFTVLGDEHALAQRTLTARYGLPVTAGQTASLLEGGKVKLTGYSSTIHLAQSAPGEYVPVQAGVGPLPVR